MWRSFSQAVELNRIAKDIEAGSIKLRRSKSKMAYGFDSEYLRLLFLNAVPHLSLSLKIPLTNEIRVQTKEFR
jgi:hypothetical protein